MAKGKKSSLAIAKERKRKLAEIRAKTEKETGLKVTPVSEIKAQIDAVSWVGKSTPTVKWKGSSVEGITDKKKKTPEKNQNYKSTARTDKITDRRFQVNSANWNANISNKIKTYTPDPTISQAIDADLNQKIQEKENAIIKDESYVTPVHNSLLQGIVLNKNLKRNLRKGIAKVFKINNNN